MFQSLSHLAAREISAGSNLRSHKLSLQLPSPSRDCLSNCCPGLHQTHIVTDNRKNSTRIVTARHRGSSLTYTTRRPFAHYEAPHCNIARLRNIPSRIIYHTTLVSPQLLYQASHVSCALLLDNTIALLASGTRPQGRPTKRAHNPFDKRR